MSFALTTGQFRRREKWVTRRLGWWFLRPGDVVMGVEKGMGLRRGETVVRLGLIRIVSVRAEPLAVITAADVVAEGFPDKDPEWFIDMFCHHNRVTPETVVNRIEFAYIGDTDGSDESKKGVQQSSPGV